MSNHEYVQVTTTHESPELASDLARQVVHRRLAACAQLDEISSVYWWDGGVQEDPEWRVTMKTTASAAPALIDAVRELHSYDVPEIIATPITAGNSAYLHWMSNETRMPA